MKQKIGIDARYREQQETLDKIAAELGVAAYRPDYHGERGDKYTVLFYTKADEKHNRMVDRQKVHYSRGEAADLKRHGLMIAPELIYKDHFWSFENSDLNGLESFEYANRGKIKLSGPNWKEALKGHIRLSLIKKTQAVYVAETGGYLEIRESDEVYNGMNREAIEAFKMAYGTEFLGHINYHDARKVATGEESVYEEYTGQQVFNFGCDFAVPCRDAELEDMIRQWNSTTENKLVDIEKISDRIDQLGGIHFIWY